MPATTAAGVGRGHERPGVVVRTSAAVCAVLALVASLVVLPQAPSRAQASAARYVTGVQVAGNGATGSHRTFTGRVAGATNGSPVALQRRTEDGWRQVASATTRTGGAFTLRVRTAAFGNAKYRVVAPAWRGRPQVASRVRDVGAYGDLRRALAGPVACWGAQSLAPRTTTCPNPSLEGTVRPDPRGTAWETDTGGGFACYVGEADVAVPTCSYGSRAKDALRVAVVGDSHGAMLLPGIKDHAARLNWRVSTYVARGCVLAAPGPADDPCHFRRADLLERLTAARYDVVIVTAYRNSSARPAAIAQAWRALQDAGSKVVVIADNPTISEELVACASGAASVAAMQRCSMPRSEATARRDPLVVAHSLVPSSVLVDTTDLLCGPDVCRAVVGNVLVYRDQHHLTATYSRSLMPYRLAALVAALAKRDQPRGEPPGAPG